MADENNYNEIFDINKSEKQIDRYYFHNNELVK
jgi:hypothetical protein